MTHDEFTAQYPYSTRKACAAAIKEGRVNGWAASGRLGREERFRIHVIVSKLVPLKQVKAKRVTAREICAAIFEKMLEDEGEVDRGDFISKAMSKGVGKATATTRFADLNAGRE